ncbi:DUF1593 domain-containing protein [Novosphingobium ovatum]|nr:DUF1593 domain-containing protein [Novosphingobium ovatum]
MAAGLAGVAVAGLMMGHGAMAGAATPAPQTAPKMAAPIYHQTPPGAKPRVVITTDPELDDFNSLLRFLLYTPDFRVEGLIYASSQYHWKGDGKGTPFAVKGREYNSGGVNLCPCTSWRWAPGDRFIDDALDAYARAYPNLRLHDRAYPSPQALRARVRWGNVAFDGDISADTPGSRLIERLLLDADPAPVYLHAWGGHSTIARALKAIEERYQHTPQWPAIRAKVVAKAVIQPSGDQDDTYATYIKPHWPEIRFMKQEGAVSLGYLSQLTQHPQDAALLGADWTRANISARGAMGAAYRVWGDGRQMVPGDTFDYFGIPGKTAKQLIAEGYHVWSPVFAPGSFISEGDTPTFLNLIDNGLRAYRPDSFGGWGGTLVPGDEYKPFGAPPAVRAAVRALIEDPAAHVELPPVPRHPFMAAAQNDFAARLAWSVTPRYAGANHAPRVAVQGARAMTVRAGQALPLRATTSDPDGNRVALRWWPYAAAGSYRGDGAGLSGEGAAPALRVPQDAKPGQTIHLIVEATDNGVPAMTRYDRVVLTVR